MYSGKPAPVGARLDAFEASGCISRLWPKARAACPERRRWCRHLGAYARHTPCCPGLRRRRQAADSEVNGQHGGQQPQKWQQLVAAAPSRALAWPPSPAMTRTLPAPASRMCAPYNINNYITAYTSAQCCLIHSKRVYHMLFKF